MARRKLKIAAAVLGLLLLGFLLALPGAVKYLRKSSGPCHEVGIHLHAIRSDARVYYLSPRWDKSGEVLPPSFPAGVQRTPARLRCGDRSAVPRDTWAANGWTPLSFPGIHRPRACCSYAFSSLGVHRGATFTARITCQYTCDDVPRVLEAAGWIDDRGSVRTRNRWVNCRWTAMERTARKVLHKVTFGYVDYPDLLEFGEKPPER